MGGGVRGAVSYGWGGGRKGKTGHPVTEGEEEKEPMASQPKRQRSTGVLWFNGLDSVVQILCYSMRHATPQLSELISLPIPKGAAQLDLKVSERRNMPSFRNKVPIAR